MKRQEDRNGRTIQRARGVHLGSENAQESLCHLARRHQRTVEKKMNSLVFTSHVVRQVETSIKDTKFRCQKLLKENKRLTHLCKFEEVRCKEK